MGKPRDFAEICRDPVEAPTKETVRPAKVFVNAATHEALSGSPEHTADEFQKLQGEFLAIDRFSSWPSRSGRERKH